MLEIALSNNERRSMLIDILKESSSLELEIAACMKDYLDSTENWEIIYLKWKTSCRLYYGSLFFISKASFDGANKNENRIY